jgi:hypothetical protein
MCDGLIPHPNGGLSHGLMTRAIREKFKLLSRVGRLRDQVETIERALSGQAS